jgi:hypothetical protein
MCLRGKMVVDAHNELCLARARPAWTRACACSAACTHSSTVACSGVSVCLPCSSSACACTTASKLCTHRRWYHRSPDPLVRVSGDLLTPWYGGTTDGVCTTCWPWCGMESSLSRPV